MSETIAGPLEGFLERISESDRFHMLKGKVHQTLRELAQDLDRAEIDYAVLGGMALLAHGFPRETVDVDVLMRPEGLAAFEEKLVGRGYRPAFSGARKSFLNTRTNVRVEFITSGEFPGDGKPKPVAFPDPAAVSISADDVKVVTLPILVELKLASGMTSPGRLKDLADVQELIRARKLSADFANELNPYVREKYAEMWTAVTQDPTREE